MAEPRDGIAIVGAGIAGLATATALTDAGIPVRVYEQAGALGEVGAGVALAPNSLRVLEALGLMDRVNEFESKPTHGMPLFDHRGNPLDNSLSGSRARPVHRADLIEVLSSRLEPGTIQLSAQLVGVDEVDDGVVLRFADGETATAAAVIGADGIHSAVRPFVVDSPEPVFSGMVAYRGLVPADQVPDWPLDEGRMFAGPGRHFLTFPLRSGTLQNFVAFVEADAEMRESWSAPGDPAMLIEEFADWAEPVRRFIGQIRTTFRWGLYDREPLPTWVRGRIALAGDAAHAMLPHAGQGANQSIEDASALAEMLRDRPLSEAAAAFEQYDLARRERASFIQRYSRRLGLEYDGRQADLADPGRLADKTDVFRWIMTHDSTDAARRVREGEAGVPLPVGAPV